MTGEEEHRAKIRTLWTTRRAGTFCATPIETIHHPLPKKKKNVNSSSPAGMFNNLTTLQAHHTTPTLPVSPIPPKIKRFPPLFRAISPLLPSTWQNNIAREAGGRGKETDTPPWGHGRAHRLPLPPAPFLFVSPSSSPLFGAVPCSESRQKKCLVWPRLSTGDRKGQRLRKGERCTHHRPTQEADCRRTTGDSCVKRDRHANNVGCVPTTRRRSREGSAGNDRRLDIASSSSCRLRRLLMLFHQRPKMPFKSPNFRSPGRGSRVAGV